MESNSKAYRLQGLSCANCAAIFEKNIKQIETVEDVQVNFGASKVTVHGDATIDQLEKAGAFDNIKVRPEEQRKVTKLEPFWKRRENVTAFISLLFIIAGYIFYFQFDYSHPVTIGLFLGAIVIGGYDLFKIGIRNLIKLTFDMNTLMTIAIIGAAIIGEWAEGAVVVFLFALSEALEEYSINKSRKSIESLINIAPDKAMIIRGDETREISVEDILIGDLMLIKPGEKIAMDGEIVDGESSVSQAAITGESMPVHKIEGDEVFAGTINEEGSLTVKVTKLVKDTTIAKIIHLVEEAQAERAPSQKFVDEFAKYYTPAIMAIAFLVAIVPPLLFSGEWSHWVYLGLAVLVVGCPCALIISTPVAIVTAIGNAANQGVLIKGGIHLEQAGKLQAIAFDKTGTLTEGNPTVTDIVSLSNLNEKDVLSISQAIESFSQHPLASAIINKAKEEKVSEVSATKFQSFTGKGAKATIDETVYYIGNPRLFEGMTTISDETNDLITQLQLEGNTVMLLGTKQDILGIIAVADQVRESSLSIIQKLKNLGLKHTVMLTGDNEATGKVIGKKLGLNEIYAELLPEDKLTAIKSLEEKYGKTAMVGDGINDAPALATATVGIAMGGAGTDAALETADIALMGDDLEKLPYTMALSRKALHVIKQNVAFSLGVKLIALLLVIPGWLTLWIAVFADVGATLIVVLNSMRLIRVK